MRRRQVTGYVKDCSLPIYGFESLKKGFHAISPTSFTLVRAQQPRPLLYHSSSLPMLISYTLERSKSHCQTSHSKQTGNCFCGTFRKSVYPSMNLDLLEMTPLGRKEKTLQEIRRVKRKLLTDNRLARHQGLKRAAARS